MQEGDYRQHKSGSESKSSSSSKDQKNLIKKYHQKYRERTDKYLEGNENQEPSCIKGLENIGSSCFFNSVLQFLFGAKSYRDKVIQLSSSQSSKRTVQLLGQIFKGLQGKGVFNSGEVIRELAHTLNIDPYTQDDAMRILDIILNSVDDDLPQNEQLIHLFKSEYTQSCSCNNDPLITETLFISGTQTCARCNQSFSKNMSIYPEQMLLIDEEEKQQQPSKYITVNGSKEVYCFVSQILYQGTGAFGHYTCVRVQRNTRYEFNDDRVYRAGARKKSTRSKMMLYKKIKFNSKELNFDDLQVVLNKSWLSYKLYCLKKHFSQCFSSQKDPHSK